MTRRALLVAALPVVVVGLAWAAVGGYFLRAEDQR